ncbi:MAG TPA: hypothetical protein VMH22_06965 [bacterium]|nr:hypothetical protein [bacterium]
MRTRFLVLAGLLLTALPGCNSLPEPPTPTLIGPDTGWTGQPTAFQATQPVLQNPDIEAVAYFDWGDNSVNGAYSVGSPCEHVYSGVGRYVVKCRFEYMREHMDWFVTETRYGDWSNPCTVNIVTPSQRWRMKLRLSNCTRPIHLIPSPLPPALTQRMTPRSAV